MWCEILVNVIGTIIGGLLIAAILFLLDEHVFSILNLTGEWDIETLTEKSLHNPYLNMRLYYKFHLLHGGHEISGSGEKIKETLSNGKTTDYERAKRIFSEITGRYERNIFSSDKVYLNIVEHGQQRQSRTTYVLTIKNKKHLVGSFISTAGDSCGQIKMTKS